MDALTALTSLVDEASERRPETHYSLMKSAYATSKAA